MREEIAESIKMIKNKKGGVIMWTIIIVILILIGIGVYFLMSGDGTPVISGGNSIPPPPALPTG